MLVDTEYKVCVVSSIKNLHVYLVYYNLFLE
eukprot:UN12677